MSKSKANLKATEVTSKDIEIIKYHTHTLVKNNKRNWEYTVTYINKKDKDKKNKLISFYIPKFYFNIDKNRWEDLDPLFSDIGSIGMRKSISYIINKYSI